MAPEPPGRRLEALAAQAQERAAKLAAELERRRGLPAGPGDLFVLPATADVPVEWAILDRGTGGKLLAVPADSGPPAGSADVEVPAGAPGGPLSLRCRFAARLEGTLFESDRRSGFLAPETVAEALHRVRQIESGTLEGSPLAEEVDADPEYVDWIREVPERARELATAAPPSISRQPPPARSWGVSHLLAAAFAVVSVGLSLWVGLLLRQVEQLSMPIFNPPSGEVVLGEGERGAIILPVPREASHVRLVLTLDSSIEPQKGYLEIVNRTGKSIWRSETAQLVPEEDLELILPRIDLPYGDYRVRVYGPSTRLLAEKRLRVQAAE